MPDFKGRICSKWSWACLNTYNSLSFTTMQEGKQVKVLVIIRRLEYGLAGLEYKSASLAG